MSEKKLSEVQLPKIFTKRPIRIKSSSKESRKAFSGRNFHTLSNEKNKKIASVCKREKSSPGKSKNSDIEFGVEIEDKCETDNQNCMALFERNYQDELTKLERIAKLFDPKNLMKIKGKKENELKVKENKKMKVGSNLFEYQKLKKVSKKKKEKEDMMDDYWRKVN